MSEEEENTSLRSEFAAKVAPGHIAIPYELYELYIKFHDRAVLAGEQYQIMFNDDDYQDVIKFGQEHYKIKNLPDEIAYAERYLAYYENVSNLNPYLTARIDQKDSNNNVISTYAVLSEQQLNALTEIIANGYGLFEDTWNSFMRSDYRLIFHALKVNESPYEGPTCIQELFNMCVTACQIHHHLERIKDSHGEEFEKYTPFPEFKPVTPFISA